MAAFKPLDGQTASETFQTALYALDVVGRWEWDAGVDRVRADAFVSLNGRRAARLVDPDVDLAAEPWRPHQPWILPEP